MSDLTDELNEIKESLKDKHSVDYTVAGIIRSKKTTKKDNPTAFIEMFDETGDFEVTLFPKLYAENIQTTKKDNIVVVKGYFELYKGEYSFIAKEIKLLEDYDG